MDSSSPTRSRSKVEGDGADRGNTQKRKARGRPLKKAGSSNVPEERRAQIRKAQETFRLRKQAATRSLEEKVESLQACVRDMSTIFLDLSDSMIQSDVLNQDPAIGKNLVSATSRFITLAKSAVEDSEDNTDAASERIITPSDPQTSHSQPRPFSVTPSINDRRRSPIIPATNFPVTEDFNPVPETLLKKEIFGNGWFGLQPEILSRLSPTDADLGRLDSSFGVILLQTTLSVAYEYLIDTTGTHWPVATDMYQFALLYHSREELLFNLRWFLGPGLRTLRGLGRAVFGFSSALSLQYLNAVNSGMEPKILNPLVDALALIEAQKNFPVVQYLNAFEVEDYIISKGAFHIDRYVVYLRVPDDDRLSQTWSGSPTRFYNSTQAEHQERQSSYAPGVVENPTSGMGVPLTGMPAGMTSSGTWSGILGFDGMQEDSYRAEAAADTFVQTPPVKNRVRTLSVPVLLQSLAKRAL
ncbi:hypothetical protein BKA65DRAFT_546193 [Rhexocercosporidium sp. MPI-PUGE-AT-0058]|nr:hypothetical protein BKA65DRAFT_546193 [Rhexocercosporidium sp. MPI-PUGE-AT-0058]